MIHSRILESTWVIYPRMPLCNIEQCCWQHSIVPSCFQVTHSMYWSGEVYLGEDKIVVTCRQSLLSSTVISSLSLRRILSLKLKQFRQEGQRRSNSDSPSCSVFVSLSSRSSLGEVGEGGDWFLLWHLCFAFDIRDAISSLSDVAHLLD